VRALVICRGIICGILLFWFVWLAVELKVSSGLMVSRVLFVELGLGYFCWGDG